MACDDGMCLLYSFFGRLVVFFAILGLMAIICVLVLKCIGEWRESSIYEMHRNQSIPLVRPHHDGKITGSINYGTCQQDLESAICSSSSSGSDDGVKEMYNTKICVICYDEQRNCFFVPCGHRATCHVCAQRIFHEENRKCPICRRVIGKTRRLFDS